jgi:hypothetical protein
VRSLVESSPGPCVRAAGCWSPSTSIAPTFASGEVNHLTSWFGESVDIDGYFLEPAEVVRDIEDAGFEVMSTVMRRAWPDIEFPSRRCYLFAQRR